MRTRNGTRSHEIARFFTIRLLIQELFSEGATMFMIDVTNMGGMTLNASFIVDFGTIDNDAAYLAHGMRLPTGDCTSESFVF
ncbi:unnamed protein product [Anisakis simplex]|uniref:Uncharacterized protein n=1 Tax=Anisakis simplex TaxID=6269 RepID=A0A0M3JA51_ANISI|nr:unnamed protein product [Anisakis simplex]